MNRIDRLRQLLEEPLLVTNLVNIRYLCGFDSSNAALLVERDRVRLFTDFRYIDAARAVEDVEVVQTKRSLVAELAETLSGTLGFETGAPVRTVRDAPRGGHRPRSGSGIVESLRAVKDERELDALRRACEITDRAFERLLVPFIGRRERDVAWDLVQIFHEEGAEAVCARVHRRLRADRLAAARPRR